MLSGYVERSATWGQNDPARQSLVSVLRRQGHVDLLLRMAAGADGVVAAAATELSEGRRDAAIDLLWRHLRKNDPPHWYPFGQRQGDQAEVDEDPRDLLDDSTDDLIA
nr:hypothetical protein GCM10020092_065020 [Actinoplanes digitatis]